VLERERGNLLVYNTGSLEAEVPELLSRGGVGRQYLSHEHESMFGSDRGAHGLGAKLLVHRDDASTVKGRGWTLTQTFSRRHTLDDDFEVIPIPGHTPGATAYLWDSGEARVLFTGDSLYVRDGEWVDALLPSSDRDRYLSSLELISELEFDCLVPWLAPAGGPWAFPVTRDEARERITAIIDRLRDR
jgi:glyoxylase-like metal-dependent hydrolase (beta-lactamase superfamily II)